jgi:hypothetical protein
MNSALRLLPYLRPSITGRKPPQEATEKTELIKTILRCLLLNLIKQKPSALLDLGPIRVRWTSRGNSRQVRLPPQQCIRITDQCRRRFVSKSGGAYGVGSFDKIPTAFAATNVTATMRIMAIAI